MDKKPGIGRVYIDFWKRSFDYKGVSSLRDYWIPVGLHLGLTALAAAIFVIGNANFWPSLPFWILTGFLILGLIPFVALTVRRLRDTGLSGLWALLLLFVGAGTCVVLALCAAGSGFLPEIERPVNLYGPPPVETTFDPQDMTVEDIYGPPPTEDTDIDPTTETPAPLYGPPPTQGGDIEPVTEAMPTQGGDVDPVTETVPALYGPPVSSELETEKKDPEETGESGSDFDPSEMTVEPLYGVPASPSVER